MEIHVVSLLARSIVVAVVVYALAVRIAFWRIPRRRHRVPGTVIAFFGAILGGVIATGLGALGQLLFAALFALGFVYAAVKAATPGSVVLTVDADGISGEKKEIDADGFQAPFVWPYHFSVEKFGHVSFELVGRAGTEVTLSFPPENSPFGLDREGKPRSTFRGTVPGTINASPVVRPSQGKYTITKRDPETGETIVNDPTWSVPRRKD